MFNNYFKIAWRSLQRNKLFSAINILGLSIGMIAAIFILLWVQHERSYDKYHKQVKNIYRVTREFVNPDGSTNIHLASIAPPFSPLLKNDFAEFAQVTSFLPDDRTVFRFGEKSFTEKKILWAEKNFFDVFSFQFLAGNPATALAEPSSIVLTKSAAIRYFGNSNPLNQVILYGEKERPMKVTGVVSDPPDNSSFHFDVLGSFETLKLFFPPEMQTQWWGFNSFSTYVVLKDGISREQIEARFPKFLDAHLEKDNAGVSASHANRLHLQPLSDIHLQSHLNGELEPTGNITSVYLFLAIAFFIILIACINFINLSTARSATRAKEVGIRKTIGAARIQLISQFLSESILYTIISFIIAAIGVAILLPYFEKFTGKSYGVVFAHSGWILAGIALLLILVGFISGSFPAFYLSSFKPTRVLKGVLNQIGNKFPLRKILVVSQFAITAILIVAVIVVLKQLQFLNNKNMGLNKEHVVILPINDSIQSHGSTIKNLLLNDRHIVSATLASRIPSGKLLDAQDWSAEIDGAMKQMGFRLSYSRVEYDYLKTFQIPLAAGRDFSKDFPTDSTEGFVINETAVKTIGWKSAQDAIGKQLIYGDRKGRVIGVARDFNFESLHNPITPVLFMIPSKDSYSFQKFIVRIDPKDIPGTIELLKNTWKQFAPRMQFEYQFLDENFNKLYASEQQLALLFEWFAGIAVFIACLGLLGLSSFATEQRKKEIGIRKVLGASISGIVSLLSGDFMKLVLLANIIAWPLAYYAMNRWLQEFAFHIGISWWIFGATALLVLLVALLTVSFQAIKAATANPVRSLRTE